MKKISYSFYKQKLHDLLYTAQNNAKICARDIRNKKYNEAKNDLKLTKEDIICFSTVMTQDSNVSSQIFKLLTQADNLATLQSLPNLELIIKLLAKIHQMDVFVNKMK